MTFYLIEDEEKFIRALARTKHSEMFKTEDDRALQKRMQKENDDIAFKQYGDMLAEIHKKKEKPADYNKRMAELKKKKVKEIA